MPKYLASWSYTNAYNNVILFHRLYDDLPQTISEDAFRKAMGLAVNAHIEIQELMAWEDGLLHAGTSTVFQIADDGTVRTEDDRTQNWKKMKVHRAKQD